MVSTACTAAWPTHSSNAHDDALVTGRNKPLDSMLPTIGNPETSWEARDVSGHRRSTAKAATKAGRLLDATFLEDGHRQLSKWSSNGARAVATARNLPSHNVGVAWEVFSPNSNTLHHKLGVLLWPSLGLKGARQVLGCFQVLLWSQTRRKQVIQTLWCISRIPLSSQTSKEFGSVTSSNRLRTQNRPIEATHSTPRRVRLEILDLACLQTLTHMVPKSRRDLEGVKLLRHSRNQILDCEKAWKSLQALRFPDRAEEPFAQVRLGGIEHHWGNFGSHQAW